MANKLFNVSNFAKSLGVSALVVAGASCKSPAPKPEEGYVVGAQVVGVYNEGSTQLGGTLNLEGTILDFYNRPMFCDDFASEKYEIGDTIWFHYYDMPTGKYNEVFADQVEDPSIHSEGTLDFWREQQKRIYGKNK